MPEPIFDAEDDETYWLGGDFVGELPGIGQFFETPAEAAGKAKLATMADVGRQYEAYRGDSQQGYQQAGANMAGMMGGLNQMVLDNTGYGIDFEAAMTPVLTPPAPPPGPMSEEQVAAVLNPWERKMAGLELAPLTAEQAADEERVAAALNPWERGISGLGGG